MPSTPSSTCWLTVLLICKAQQSKTLVQQAHHVSHSCSRSAQRCVATACSLLTAQGIRTANTTACTAAVTAAASWMRVLPASFVLACIHGTRASSAAATYDINLRRASMKDAAPVDAQQKNTQHAQYK
jgi:hypothetical protein